MRDCIWQHSRIAQPIDILSSPCVLGMSANSVDGDDIDRDQIRALRRNSQAGNTEEYAISPDVPRAGLQGSLQKATGGLWGARVVNTRVSGATSS